MQPNRLYLQWARRQILGDEKVQLDYVNKHVGYIDVDESKLSAKGLFAYTDMCREKVPFEMWKVSDAPSKKPPMWMDFSVEKSHRDGYYY